MAVPNASVHEAVTAPPIKSESAFPIPAPKTPPKPFCNDFGKNLSHDKPYIAPAII
ncbi:uncharacterized protein METZ01_LOCUS455759, partial [marine metagenome]